MATKRQSRRLPVVTKYVRRVRQALKSGTRHFTPEELGYDPYKVRTKKRVQAVIARFEKEGWMVTSSSGTVWSGCGGRYEQTYRFA